MEPLANQEACMLMQNGWYMLGTLCPPTEASRKLCESLAPHQVLPTVPPLVPLPPSITPLTMPSATLQITPAATLHKVPPTSPVLTPPTFSFAPSHGLASTPQPTLVSTPLSAPVTKPPATPAGTLSGLPPTQSSPRSAGTNPMTPGAALPLPVLQSMVSPSPRAGVINSLPSQSSQAASPTLPAMQSPSPRMDIIHGFSSQSSQAATPALPVPQPMDPPSPRVDIINGLASQSPQAGHVTSPAGPPHLVLRPDTSTTPSGAPASTPSDMPLASSPPAITPIPMAPLCSDSSSPIPMSTPQAVHDSSASPPPHHLAGSSVSGPLPASDLPSVALQRLADAAAALSTDAAISPSLASLPASLTSQESARTKVPMTAGLMSNGPAVSALPADQALVMPLRPSDMPCADLTTCNPSAAVSAAVPSDDSSVPMLLRKAALSSDDSSLPPGAAAGEAATDAGPGPVSAIAASQPTPAELPAGHSRRAWTPMLIVPPTPPSSPVNPGPQNGESLGETHVPLTLRGGAFEPDFFPLDQNHQAPMFPMDGQGLSGGPCPAPCEFVDSQGPYPMEGPYPVEGAFPMEEGHSQPPWGQPSQNFGPAVARAPGHVQGQPGRIGRGGPSLRGGNPMGRGSRPLKGRGPARAQISVGPGRPPWQMAPVPGHHPMRPSDNSHMNGGSSVLNGPPAGAQTMLGPGFNPEYMAEDPGHDPMPPINSLLADDAAFHNQALSQAFMNGEGRPLQAHQHPRPYPAHKMFQGPSVPGSVVNGAAQHRFTHRPSFVDPAHPTFGPAEGHLRGDGRGMHPLGSRQHDMLARGQLQGDLLRFPHALALLEKFSGFI